jgi:hypothetical protein
LISAAARSYYDDMGLTLRTSTSNNHAAVGGIEAEVKTLKERLTKLMSENPDDWDELIDEAIMLERARVRTDEGVSAFELRFGKKMRIPAYLRFGVEPKTKTAAQHKKLVERAQALADAKALEQKRRFDAHRQEIRFEIGQKVYLEDHYRTGFEPKRIGPFKVRAKKSALSYEIAECEDGPKIGRRYKIVNARDLMSFPNGASDAGKDEENEKDEDEEQIVVKVLGHKKAKGSDEGWQFKVRWRDGDVTWEPSEHFYDVKKDGAIVYNDKFRRYAFANGFRLAERKGNKGVVVKSRETVGSATISHGVLSASA